MLRLEEAEAFTRPSRVAQRQATAGSVVGGQHDMWLEVSPG